MKRVLFICTGNVCRSPMAEGLFRDMTKGKAEAMSAGVGAMYGLPPSDHAVKVMDELKINIRDLRSKPVTEELVRKADFIVVMTQGHLDTMLMMYPRAADKIFLMCEFDKKAREKDVADPIGLSVDVYRMCRDQIRKAMGYLLEAVMQNEQKKRIAIGADHGGVKLKKNLSDYLKEEGFEVSDLGTFSDESVDYPDFAVAVAKELEADQADWGILICKSGVGMSMTANKFAHIRAALVRDVTAAKLSRQHNDANVLCMGASEVSEEKAREIAKVWLTTEFEGGRHERRVNKMSITNHDDCGALAASDKEIFELIQKEEKRQEENIELIPSENSSSKAVREAQGSRLTDKYAEGYPAKRWYGGCEFVDQVEQLAIDRAKKVFGAEHANVQPHSGSQANMAVYFSALKPGDKIMTMDLAHGGHLTHGHKMNFSGRFFEVLHYGVRRDTEMIDYEELAKMAQEFKPRMIVAGASAYPRILEFAKFRQIADSVGALFFVDMAHIAGLVAAGVHPSPIPHADFVTTTTHKTLRGPRGGVIFCKEKFAKDVDSNVFPGIQGGPLMHVIAAKAVCFGEALKPEFKQYQEQVARNAKALCEGMKKNGYRIVSGGTDNHLMLVDVQPLGITGKDAQETLDKAGITVNKNAIPFDQQSPFKAGGIRLGSPVVTTRGMKESEMFDIANWIHESITNRTDANQLAQIRKEVMELTAKFPLPV
ncbi:MAG: ribose 5-phosphate isomerase B [Verrucomicrobiota bacterium]